MMRGEPTLEELLSEPIVRLLMRSDGISLGELVELCRAVRALLHDASGSERTA
ncbi:MAG TPA: hypothetical protein VHG30_01505 [Microvirga sp.]|nr:hypothetical protein [Microvirga sp.]